MIGKPGCDILFDAGGDIGGRTADNGAAGSATERAGFLESLANDMLVELDVAIADTLDESVGEFGHFVTWAVHEIVVD